jgi:hypothetical protein
MSKTEGQLSLFGVNSSSRALIRFMHAATLEA